MLYILLIWYFIYKIIGLSNKFQKREKQLTRIVWEMRQVFMIYVLVWKAQNLANTRKFTSFNLSTILNVTITDVSMINRLQLRL